jgi:hypothetical protein
MPQVRVTAEAIQSFSPGVEWRGTGKVAVLNGKNFSFSVSGVNSDFATRLIAGDFNLSRTGEVVQSVEMNGRWHVYAGNRVYLFNPGLNNYVGSFSLLLTLPMLQVPAYDSIPDSRRQISSIFVGSKNYVCLWNHGVYRVNEDNTYFRLTSSNTPGFPADTDPVLFISETNGRALFITNNSVYFSNTGDAEDLTPALGGAGLQVISELVAGKPIAALRVTNGITLWTDTSAVAGEFIGGDLVFRWYQTPSSVRPLSQGSAVQVADGYYLFLSSQGIYAVDSFESPKSISPLFNEFLRDYLRGKDFQTAMTWYDAGTNRLYVSLRESNAAHVETFVYNIGLDKWGIMNHSHLGLFAYATAVSSLAYTDANGIAHRIVPAEDFQLGRELPNSPGSFVGLDSFVQIGPIRGEQLTPVADSMTSIQEIIVHRNPRYETLSYLDEGIYEVGDLVTEDEGVLPASSLSFADEGELFDSRFEAQNIPDFDLFSESDVFGADSISGVNYGYVEAEFVRRDRSSDVFVGGVIGYYHRLTFTAEEPNAAFNIGALDLTLAYAGQTIGG